MCAGRSVGDDDPSSVENPPDWKHAEDVAARVPPSRTGQNDDEKDADKLCDPNIFEIFLAAMEWLAREDADGGS